MSNRLFFFAYETSAGELGSYLQIAKSALQTAPAVPGFAFSVFKDPERPRRFAEIFVMPDPEVEGQDAAIKAYHFSSSYQPERATCFERGARFASFRGRVLGGDPPAPFEGTAMRWTPLWAEADDAVALEEALAVLGKGVPGRVHTVGLCSTDRPKEYALCEAFASGEDVAAAGEAEKEASEEVLAALELVRGATREGYGLPAVFGEFG